jgi:hypothetical protein
MEAMDAYTYRRDLSIGAGADITGYDVEAIDGRIGKIDAATYEPGMSCIVVDTGFWIFGKKRMIPAGCVRVIDTFDRTVEVSMTKDQIKSAPDLDEERHLADEAGYHREVGAYYDQYRPFF